MDTRRKLSREFKLETINLVTVQGVAMAEAARDLDFNESVLRRWVKESALDTAHGFPGGGNMKPELEEITQLKKEVAKLRMERDLLKKAAAYFAKESI